MMMTAICTMTTTRRARAPRDDVERNVTPRVDVDGLVDNAKDMRRGRVGGVVCAFVDADV